MRRPFLTLLCAGLLLAPATNPAEAAKGKAPPKTATKAAKPATLASPAAEVGAVLHSAKVSFGFDPHPSQIEPLGRKKLAAGGTQLGYRFELREGWSSAATPVLQKLGALVTLEAAGEGEKLFDLPKAKLEAGKLKKGQLLGEKRQGRFGARLTASDPVYEKKKLVGITLTCDLLGFGVDAPAASGIASGSANPVVADASGSTPALVGDDEGTPRPAGGQTALTLARSLMGKALALPAVQAAARARLLQRALGILDGVTSPQAAALTDEIKAAQAAVPTTIAPAPGATPADATASATAAGSPVAGTPTAPASPQAAAALDLVRQAEKQFATGNESEGRNLLRQAVEKDPGCYQGWVLLGKNAFANNKYARAREALDKAVALRPLDADSALTSCKAAIFLGDPEAGLAPLQRLANEHPRTLRLRLALAEGYFLAANHPACEAECLKIIEGFKDNRQAQQLLAKAREKMK